MIFVSKTGVAAATILTFHDYKIGTSLLPVVERSWITTENLDCGNDNNAMRMYGLCLFPTTSVKHHINSIREVQYYCWEPRNTDKSRSPWSNTSHQAQSPVLSKFGQLETESL